MQRISTLLQKIEELAKNDKNTAIEIDLMMDYTRVLYADLLELRNRVGFNESLLQETTASRNPSPTPTAVQTAVAQPEPEPIVPAVPETNVIPQPEPTRQAEAEQEEERPMPPPVAEIPAVKQTVTKDIRSIIGINDKYQFISELFGNNKDAYNEVLDEINNTETFAEAKELLATKVEEQYGWDKESLTADMFYTTLSRFFSSM